MPSMSVIAEKMTKIRNLRAESIVLRRGGTSLAAQSVRVEKTRMGRQVRSEGGSEQRADAVVHGAVGLNIQVEDRFTSGGILFEVSFVHPNRSVMTLADAVVVE